MQLFIVSALLGRLGLGQHYVLQSSFAGQTFLDGFEFYDSWDPTYGFVHYVDQKTAQANGMLKVTGSSVAWGVETTQVLDPYANLGRLSIRLQSKQSWTHGLFILDLAHMPANLCGVWPAFWSLGSGIWPSNGEIDIIEYTNNLPNNLMALHTSDGCSVAGSGQTGTLLTDICDVAHSYTGCGVASTQPNNEGLDFNDRTNGGGVYVLWWTSTSIQVFFFPRHQIPAAILGVDMREISVADTASFGLPVANFQGSCDFDAHFFNHTLMFTTDFCGSYAGPTWQEDRCPMLNPTNSWQSCNDFVALNPQAFTEAYWEVNYLNVYQAVPGSGPAPISSSLLSSVTPAATSSSSMMSTLNSNAQGRSSTPVVSLSTSVTPLSTLSGASSGKLSVASPPLASAGGSTTTLATSSRETKKSTIAPTPLPRSLTGGSSPASASATCTSATCIEDITVVQTVTVDFMASALAEQRRQGPSVSDEVTGTHWPEPTWPAPPGLQSTAFASTFYLRCLEVLEPQEGGQGTRCALEARDSSERATAAHMPVPGALSVPIDLTAEQSNPVKRAEIVDDQASSSTTLPGGIIGWCSVPGSSCNEHHKRHSDGEVDVEEEHQDRGLRVDGLDVTNDEESPMWEHDAPAIGFQASNARVKDFSTVVVVETMTLPDTIRPSSATISFDPENPDWTATPTLGPRDTTVVVESVVVVIIPESLPPPRVPYTPTTFSFRPSTNRLVKAMSTVPAEARDTQASASQVVPTTGDSYLQSKDTPSATCTPVATIGANGKATPIGCLGPQGLTKSQEIAVASHTTTLDIRYTDIPHSENMILHVAGSVDEGSLSAQNGAGAMFATAGFVVSAMFFFAALLLV